jgi:predicted Zn-dependent protease
MMSKPALIKHGLAILLCLVSCLPPQCSFAMGEDDPLWNRPSYAKKVILVGQRLLAVNHITEHVTFTVVTDETINAVSRDDASKVLVHTALLKVVESDDELAYVLGHEIGHIIKRHGLKRRVIVGGLGTVLGVALGMYTGETPEQKADFSEMAAWRLKPYLYNFTNEMELTADQVGIDLMAGAGYNPWGGYHMAQKIFGDGYLLRLFRSHPNAKTRLARIETQIKTQYPNAVMYPNPDQPLTPPDPNQAPAQPIYTQD